MGMVISWRLGIKKRGKLWIHKQVFCLLYMKRTTYQGWVGGLVNVNDMFIQINCKIYGNDIEKPMGFWLDTQLSHPSMLEIHSQQWQSGKNTSFLHVSEGISQGGKDEKSTLNGNEYNITLDNLNLLWKKWRHTHFTAELKFLFVSTMERSQDVYLEEQKVTCLNLCWPMRGWVKTLRPTMNHTG
jgi:hypothetical protein